MTIPVVHMSARPDYNDRHDLLAHPAGLTPCSRSGGVPKRASQRSGAWCALAWGLTPSGVVHSGAGSGGVWHGLHVKWRVCDVGWAFLFI